MKKYLLCGCALAIAAPIPAFAQSGGAVEEIIVTARKRAETLQEVPLSVSALAGLELEKIGIENVTDLYGRVPGLYFAQGSITNPTSANSYLTVRGVGWNAGLEPAVGVFIDGMFQPQIGYDLAFLDLERVEVLRGPQGTLFGRNTQGGALNMVTRKPDDTMRGSVRMEYAEFNTWKMRGSLSGPIGGDFFAGVSVDYSKTDGYIRNVVREEDTLASERLTGRGVLRWLPNDDLEIVFIGDASLKNFNEMMRGVPLAANKAEKTYFTYADEDAPDRSDNVGAQLNIDYDITDTVTLTSISGYRKSVTNVVGDTDTRLTNQDVTIFPAVPPATSRPVAVQGATTPFKFNQRFVSQELRLAGSTNSLDWLVGAYYFDQNSLEDRFRYLGAGVSFPFAVYIEEHFFEDRNGWAGFGQASYRPIESLEFTLGARYSDEDVETGGLRLIYTSAPALTDKAATTGGDNVSILASVSYDVTQDALIYATFAQGWKAGGINRNPSNAAGVVPYKDESSENYEIGFKTSWADNRINFNGAVYWIDIKDQQVANFIPPPATGGTPISAIENAASSKVRGFEAELTARMTDALSFDGTIAYSDTKFNDYTRTYTATNFFVMDGLNFENIPEFTANASATYVVPVSVSNQLEFYLNYRYVGKVSTQDNFRGALASNQQHIPAYDRLDGRVSLLRDGDWRFTAYVDNILNSWDYTGASSDPYFFTTFPVYAQPLEPRQFGIVISKTF